MKCKLYSGSIVEKLENFENLRYEDQQKLIRIEKHLLKRPKDLPNVKIKEELKDEHDLKEEQARESLISKQSNQFFSNRYFLQKYSDSEIQDFLSLNGCGQVLNDNVRNKKINRKTYFVISFNHFISY